MKAGRFSNLKLCFWISSLSLDSEGEELLLFLPPQNQKRIRKPKVIERWGWAGEQRTAKRGKGFLGMILDRGVMIADGKLWRQHELWVQRW